MTIDVMPITWLSALASQLKDCAGSGATVTFNLGSTSA